MSNYKLKYCRSAESIQTMNWVCISAIEKFTSPWALNNKPKVFFRAAHNRKSLFFRFDVYHEYTDLQPDSDNSRLVLKSERVELFFKPNDNKKFYYCIEMDISGRIFSYRAKFHHQFDYAYEWPRGYEVACIKHAEGYRVIGEIKLDILKLFGVLEGNKMQAGVFVGHRLCNPNAEGFEWMTWVNPRLEVPDFHVPASFGIFELTDLH
jgi:hypothetical protein